MSDEWNPQYSQTFDLPQQNQTFSTFDLQNDATAFQSYITSTDFNLTDTSTLHNQPYLPQQSNIQQQIQAAIQTQPAIHEHIQTGLQSEMQQLQAQIPQIEQQGFHGNQHGGYYSTASYVAPADEGKHRASEGGKKGTVWQQLHQDVEPLHAIFFLVFVFITAMLSIVGEDYFSYLHISPLVTLISIAYFSRMGC